MSQEEYLFKLRKDMPLGFKENDRFPEYPAMVKYLSIFDSRKYTLKVFYEVLQTFNDLLKKGYIPYCDRKSIGGLTLLSASTDSQLVVACRNDGISEHCNFGTLTRKK